MQRSSVSLRLLFLCFSFLLVNGLHSQDLIESIYFQSETTLLKLHTEQSILEEITSAILLGNSLFSNSGQQLAFRDSDGIWISSLSNWNPELIIADERQGGYGWYWTPDDTRLVVKISSWAAQNIVSEDVETFAFNLNSQTLENWAWGICNQIARNLEDQRIALICQPDPWVVNPEPGIIALFWGGEYEAFIAENYEILIENTQIFPHFDWFHTEDSEQLVFLGPDPNRNLQDDPLGPEQDIFLVSPGLSPEIVVSHEQYPIRGPLRVSPDAHFVAYAVDCTHNQPQSCLQVTDLETGEALFNDQTKLVTSFILDMAWYEDNENIALLAQDPLFQHSILVGNILENDFTEYFRGNTSGSIVVDF